MPPRKRPEETKETAAAEAAQQEVNVEELMSANEAFATENDEQRSQIEKLLAENKRLKDLNVTHEKRLEAQEQQVGQDGTAHFDGDELIKVQGQSLDDPNMMKKLDIMKFMEEPVAVEIHEVADEQADIGFAIWVNGQSEVFRRGERKTVKRKFVEGLARAKKTGYGNQLRVNRDTGEQEYIYPSKTGLRYPFSVVHDANRMGADWLKAVLRQP